jgi:protein-disulfide isomerase
LERALGRFKGKVQQVLYHVAWSPASNVATQAALCAGEQGKFWEFHRMLYARQPQWHRLSDPLNRLLEFAKDLGVDTAALKSCVKSGRMRKLVEADKTYGRSLRVRSTPTLFINNRRVVGAHSEADLVRIIQRELTRAQRSAQ